MVFATHAFFVLMTAIKAFIYYYLVGIENYRPVIVLMTVAYLAAIYFICGSKKFAYCVISLLISVLMLTNVLYNRYFHMFFSLDTISQAGKLREVGGIALDLLKPPDMLLFIDIILIIIIMAAFKNPEQFQNLDKEWISPVSKTSILLLMAGSLLFFAVNPLDSKLVTAISHQEIFSWYFSDSLYRSGSETGHTAEAEEMEIETAGENQLSDKGYLHGTAYGRNLIVIQIEAFQNFLINAEYNGQEVTPNLNRLVAGESIYFSNYYQQLGKGNTSDAEFVTNNSLYPVIFGPVYELYQNNRFYGLPWVLRENGYQTMVLHGYKKSFWNRENAYPGQGFDKFIGEEDLVIDEKIGLGLSDKSFFRQSLDYLKEMEQPFYSFIITLSSHVPYKIPETHQKLELLPEDKNTLFGDYLQAACYTDEAIGEFLDDLNNLGLYDNSMIVLYGDHFGIDCRNDAAERVKAFLGHDYTYNEMLNIPLIIHLPGSGIHETVDTTGGQVDFMPTVLNLLGIPGDHLVMFGQDLLQAKSGFAASQTYMLKGSFIDDNIVFEMARTGVFEDSKAWDKKTGEPVSLDSCREGYKRAVMEITKCTNLLEKNLLKDMQLSGGTASADAKGHVPDLPQADDEMLLHHETVIDITMLTDIADDPDILDSFFDKGFRLYLTELETEGPESVTVPGGYSFDMLSAWLTSHPDSLLVLPVNDGDISILKLLNKLYPDICPQIVPKIKNLIDYVTVEYQGFRRIILDLSALPGIDTDKLSVFLDRNTISGAVLSEEQAEDMQLSGMLELRKIAVLKVE
jgi:phosphoglycerol transferase MdoB-like AlkP superfamily enzyme